MVVNLDFDGFPFLLPDSTTCFFGSLDEGGNTSKIQASHLGILVSPDSAKAIPAPCWRMERG